MSSRHSIKPVGPAWTSIATHSSIGTLTWFTETNALRLSQPQGFYKMARQP